MADQRFKVEKGLFVSGANNIITGDATVGGNTTVEGDLLLVKGNFTVQGGTTFVGATYYDTDIIPLADNIRLLGKPSNTFVASLGNTTIYQFLNPSANNKQLGNTTQRWDASITNLDASGVLTITGNVSVNSTALTVTSNGTNKAVGINSAPISTAALYVVGNTIVNGSITINNNGSLVVNSNITANGGITVNGAITTSNNSLTLNKAAFYNNTATIANTSANIIDGFPLTLSRFAKVLVTVENTAAVTNLVHMIELLITHDNNGNVIATKYGEVYNTKLGTFDAVITGANVHITYTATSAAAGNTQTVKTLRQQILI